MIVRVSPHPCDPPPPKEPACQWELRDGRWFFIPMPRLSVRPFRIDGLTVWETWFGETRVKHLDVALSDELAKEMAYEYFDARIELKERWD